MAIYLQGDTAQADQAEKPRSWVFRVIPVVSAAALGVAAYALACWATEGAVRAALIAASSYGGYAAMRGRFPA